jgi:hypothetical protein
MPGFIRLCRRLDEVKPILQTIIEFNRLAKTEVGGIHGHILSPRFVQLLEEFHEVEGRLTNMDKDFQSTIDQPKLELVSTFSRQTACLLRFLSVLR